MKQFILRKIRIYPVGSALIAGLMVSIVILESGPLVPTTAVTSSSPSIPVLVSESDSPSHTEENTDLTETRSNYPEIEKKFEETTRQHVAGLGHELAQLLVDKKFHLLREKLLGLASVAVAEDDKNRLGYILNLLGQISIQEQDVYSAKVYLSEAADIFETLKDDIGVAQVNLQLGRAHLKTREIARTAGTAYDELQVGRWHLANDMLDVAEEYILASIEKNLSINRFGSAASAYESLAKLYIKKSDPDKTSQAVENSALMFASSGRVDRAHSVLHYMPRSENSGLLKSRLRTEIALNNTEYKDSILQIERARDYRRLYNYYRNQGDDLRAWKFRLLASESLSQVSQRALFHRQQGVLAILYNSNDSMDLAEQYFFQARETFDFNGLDKLSEETDSLSRQIY